MEKTTLERGAGLILPIYALPSPYGIGTLGETAFRFIDFLKEAGQKYWQVLPVGPTSYGDSPYQSYSAFAGNPYFIDLTLLCEEGLLEKEKLDNMYWCHTPAYVDYDVIYQNRFSILREAFSNSQHTERPDYQEFCQKNEFWLDDYALFMACKDYYGGVAWSGWARDLKLREPSVVSYYQRLLAEDVEFYKFIQYKFFEQWDKVRTYANEQGIQMIGDMPIYAALDSADVWVYHQYFQLDEERNPKKIAGVPPDAFSDDGQLWGNPLYDWDALEKDDFLWWRERMKSASLLYDVVRIDHFIGIVRYYAIPYGETTAVNGEFYPGPGKKLTDVLKEACGDTKIIAEDLGVVIDAVRELKKECGFPGMKVLEFAFDGGNDNDHLPHTYEPNTIVYGGTHDNETLVGYFSRQTEWVKQYAKEYMELSEEEYQNIVPYLFKLAYRSVASVAIFQVQDVLGLGNEARTNAPSTLGMNWKWRLTEGQLGEEQAQWLKRLVWLFGR